MLRRSQNSRAFVGLKKTCERFIKIRGDTRQIALGMALGLFIGFTPTLGFHMALAIFLASLFKWNKITAAAGVWVTNPVTAPFIYGLTYFMGARFLGIRHTFNMPADLNLQTVMVMLQKAPEILLSLTVGCIMLGLPIAIVGYYITYSAVEKYREDIKKKVARQKEKIAQYRAMRKEKRKKIQKKKRSRRK